VDVMKNVDEINHPDTIRKEDPLVGFPPKGRASLFSSSFPVRHSQIRNLALFSRKIQTRTATHAVQGESIIVSLHALLFN
jgi:hypothetical protein